MSSDLIDKIKKLPTTPGVYLFHDGTSEVIYVGKAASLRSRVGSYFKKNLAYERPIEFVMERVTDIEVRQTDSVVEAFFLEQELIKKFQPAYNVLGKDDKSFVYLCVTDEDFPRFEILRRTDLEVVSKRKITEKEIDQRVNCHLCGNDKFKNRQTGVKFLRIYGPFDSKFTLTEALKVLRKIFPYHNRKEKTEKGCLDFQLGLCPGPYVGAISKNDYRKNIHAIEGVMKGKKKELIGRLEKEMKQSAKKLVFERAVELRNQIFALRHIQDLALINDKSNFKVDDDLEKEFFRVEGYDISNISGQFNVGSMVVFDNVTGELIANKSQYRKFKIKTIIGADDTGSLREVIFRRFGNDWTTPNLLLIDGGQGQVSAVRATLKSLGLELPILGVAKGPERKKLDLRLELPDDLIGQKKLKIEQFLKRKDLIRNIRDEAHRFAINYHRKLREKLN